MKTKLTIVLLATIALFCSCKHTCDDVVKPANLQPINWNDWNDAYTVFYNFYDNEEDACHSFDGDTILCYGHIAKYLYDDYSSLNPDNSIYLESGHKQQGVEVFFSFIYENSSERDSLISLLNRSTYSDTCFVKGVFKVYSYTIHVFPKSCTYVSPVITICRLEDIWFKH